MRSSQIGKGNSKASQQSQLSLKKAMQEAQRMANNSPLAPIELPESAASTILHVLQDIVETDGNQQKTLADPPKIMVSLQPDASIVKVKSADEGNK